MDKCTAAIGSLTIALKAHSALDLAGLDNKVVKLEPSMTKKGCAYGIEFFCDDYKRVRSTFSANKISASTYLKGTGGTLI